MADVQLLKILIEKVDWTEPWLLALFGFHLSTFTLILLARRYQFIQAVLLGVLSILCAASERINEWCASNYQKFATEQYFDASGFFISVVYSAPIVFNCLTIVVSWLYLAWQLAGKLGSIKVRHQYRVADKKKIN